jgi:hypothetical protein
MTNYPIPNCRAAPTERPAVCRRNGIATVTSFSRQRRHSLSNRTQRSRSGACAEHPKVPKGSAAFERMLATLGLAKNAISQPAETPGEEKQKRLKRFRAAQGVPADLRFTVMLR